MEYVKIANVNEFIGSHSKTVRLLGRAVGIIKKEDGTFFAIEASCKHQGADLLAEYNGGSIVTCPRHQWQYDLENGHCLTNDSPVLRRYGLKREGNNIMISLTPLEEEDNR